MFCCHCGMSLPEGTKFCTRCGAPTAEPSPDPVPPQPSAPMQPPPVGGTEYWGGDGYVEEDEGTELLIPGTPWAPPQNGGASFGGVRPPATAPIMAPAVAPPEKKRKGSPVVIAAVILVCLLGIAAILVAVFLSMNQESETTSPDESEPGGRNAVSTVNWAYYEGNWNLEGAQLTLRMDGDDLSLKLTVGGQAVEGTCTPEGDSQRLEYTDAQGKGGAVVLTARGDELKVTAESDASNGFHCTNKTASKGVGSATDPATSASSAPTASQPVVAPVVAAGSYLYYNNGQTVSQYPNALPVTGGDFHFWPTDSVRITNADLDMLTHQEIQAIRNEIYARYGYPFSSEQWDTLFGGMTWYIRNDNYVAPTFPEIVQDNIVTITAYESAKGWR